MVRKCSNAGCGKNGDLKCSKCGAAQYCSKECQVGHWSVHSATCYQKTSDNKILLESLSVKQLKYMLKMKAASMSEGEREALKEGEARVVEKAPLISLVESSMSQSEMKQFLASYAQEKNAPPQTSSARKPRKPDSQLEDLKRATPEQLRQQARVFRRDPDLVRRSNPQLAHLSNAELLASAEQMEAMADNPAMLREMIEQMERMTPEEREAASRITPEQREAINSMTPAQKEQMQKMSRLSAEQRAHIMKFQNGLAGTINEEWANSVVALLRNRGEAFKVMVKALFEVQDDQADPWIELVAGMDEWSIRLICRFLGFIQAVGRPLVKAYEVLDKSTFGMGRHIVMLVVGIVLYYSAITTWRVTSRIVSWLYALFVAAPVKTETASVPSMSPSGDPVSDAAKKWAAENANGEFDF